TFDYGAAVHRRDTIERLAACYAGELRGLIAHCRGAGTGGCTPADFPLAGLDQPALDALPGSERGVEDVYPLTPMQEGMHFHSLLAPGSGVYVGQFGYLLEGPLDVGALERAWQGAVARHEALRASFAWEGLPRPVQVIRREAALPFRVEDWRGLGGAERQARLERHLEADRAAGFDTRRAPLMRVALFRLDEEEHQLVWTHHHLVMDGWSLSLLLRDVLAVYAARVRGEEPRAAPAVRYREYVAWLERQDRGRAERFWREALAGFDAPTPLPVSGPSRPGGEGQGTAALPLSAERSAALRERARGWGVTPGTLVQGAWALLLSRYTGEDDVLFGATVSGRPAELEGAEEIVGLFINTLPVRVRLRPEATLREWLAELQREQVEAREYDYAPLVEVRKWSGVPSGRPLFESLVVFETQPVDQAVNEWAGNVEGVRVRNNLLRGQSNYPLSLVAHGVSQLTLEIHHDRGLVEAEAAERLASHLETLLEGMAAHPRRRLAEVGLLRESERRQVLETWNDTAAPSPAACVHELFAEQAARTPGAVALVHDARKLDYAELDRRSSRLARRLARSGVGPDVRVGVCAERSPEMVAGLLAILKAGGAYVPLDPAYPPERLAHMLADAGIGVLMVQPGLLERLPEHAAEVVLLDAAADGGERDGDAGPPAVAVSPENAAYVVYTSGSTGAPKGVVVTHAGAASLLAHAVRTLGAAPGDNVLQTASPSFDASLLEVFVALLSGATLHVAERDVVLSPERLGALLLEGEIDVWVSTPTLLDSLPAGDFPALRTVTTGGERCSAGTAARWSRGRRLLNMYGPTETTIYATAHECAPGAVEVPPIGRPVAGARAYVLDAWGGPLPVGVPGELYVGGAGVARGYLGRPELTAERFVPDPFGPAGGRLYRTGDRARWLDSGELEYLGRLDQQVKVRGVRIEPGEVEAAMRAHPGVRDAAVTLREDRPGQRVLVGYHVPATGRPAAAAELRAFLRSRLPAHMVPGAFVALDRLPLTPGGKLDRRALPAPGSGPDGAERTPPRTPVEAVLARVFAGVLGREVVGVHDDFFELGGHSLLATRVVSGVREELGAELPLRALFDAPTVAGLAGHVEAALDPARCVSGRIPRRAGNGPAPLSFAQQRLWFIHQLDRRSSAYNMPFALRLRGRLDVRALRRSLTELVRRHEAVRTALVDEGGQPMQVVLPAAPVSLPVLDLTSLPGEPRRVEAMRRLSEAGLRPFDLERGPLLRALLVRGDAGEWALCFTMHHVVSDGWSMGVLVREVSALYGAYSRGEESPLPALEVQYADFAVWQREWMSGERMEEDLRYWREKLDDAPRTLELPTDFPRRSALGATGRGSPFELSARATRALRELGRREGTTLFMTLLAAWQALLGRYAGQDDVIVGTVIANRTRAELEGLIGFFVNSLVLRGDLSGEPAFRELLGRVRETTLGAFAHQDLPFERLVEELAPERSLAHNPLFQVVFALQNTDRGVLALGDIEMEPLGLDEGGARFDLSATLFEDGERLVGHIEYRTDLFEGSTVERMAGHFRLLLEAALADPERRLSGVPLLHGAERARVLEAWNDTGAALPEGCIHHLVSAQVERTPRALAVVSGGESLTYAELERRSDRLAQHLRTLGVRPEARVGICLERGLELVVALLGVLKAGGAYVPLDPAYPAERLASMLEDAAPAVLLTRQALLDRLPPHGAPAVCLDRDAAEIARHRGDGPRSHSRTPALSHSPSPDSLAYVIYTSGSTGKPKGVGVPHRALANHMRWMQRAYPLAATDRVLQKTPLSFDASVWEFYAPLLAGATLVMAPPEAHRDPAELVRAVVGEEITVLQLVPSLLRVLAEEGGLERCGTLRRLFCGGEALGAELAGRARALLGAEVVNLYGPTEACIDATSHAYTGAEGGPTVPIGRPVDNLRAYVLDAGGAPVPVGLPGELYLGGAGLARGYLGRPEQTAETFVPDAFGAEAGG
ncbi:MAG TPA: amino acid adenylation domain-containing protein, partial [Longimicrobiaceae bacterium]|nr:amino acid adenylation domain-containing protein [Longimicrobiaceae bacterium]